MIANRAAILPPCAVYALRAVIAFTPLLGAIPIAAADGPATFADFCAPCHGLDGHARTPAGRKLGAKDLAESKTTDAEIERQILNGMRDKNGKEKMPSFKDRVPSGAIAALVAHVKTFRQNLQP